MATGWQAPMLATLAPEAFSRPGWIYERKLDGVRAIVVRDGAQTTLYSRNHKVMNASYPELVEAVGAQASDRFVADGEIVAFDGRQTSFSKLQGRIHVTRAADIEASGVAVFLYLFDLLSVLDRDVTGLPLRDRKTLLRDAIDFADPLRFSSHRNHKGDEYFAEACRRGWEGLVAKRSDSPYLPGRRTPDWLKFKCVRDQEFVVGGFTDPKGTRTGFGALLVGYYQDGQLVYAGKVGTGYDQKTLTWLRAELGRLEVAGQPFAGKVPEPHARWVRPELVAQVGFSEWTPDGRLRHPRYTGLRTDKAARDVRRET